MTCLKLALLTVWLLALSTAYYVENSLYYSYKVDLFLKFLF
jgi:hypothetical protein